ncbi:cupin domain-containing protein [Corallococcus interemptor]|uniref:cupin domain-containing protein n=1 Tax=Corallococcus TaxID=83461 RepID=UPI001CBB830B|nr:cupin domain-containing protein [Corallococcus sp. AS-1-12]
MTVSSPEVVAGLRRRLWVYRMLVVGLCVALLGLLLGLRRALTPLPPPDVEVIDVRERMAALEKARPGASDVSETYFASDTSSVHQHLMGRGQTCPLHIHRAPFEATIIVSGEAHVWQVWGEEGRRMERRGVHGPGWLVASPPFTGHEWRNPDEGRALSNLVFTVPGFDGNLYVSAEDARLLRGTAPFAQEPREALAGLRKRGVKQEETPLPVLQGRMSRVLLEGGAWAVKATPAAPVVAYVAAGRGIAEVAEARPLHEGQLWVLRRDARVRSEEGSPVALYVFHPPPEAVAGR